MKFISWIVLTSTLVAPLCSQTAQQKSAYLKEAQIDEKGETVQIIANSPRPLQQALEALFQKYGWVVDYEDPEFTSDRDLVKDEGPGKQTLPAGGRFTVEFPAKNPEEEKILQLVVDAYNKSNNPGQYELRKGSQGNFAAVGTQARNAMGKLSAQRPLFDTPIMIPAGKRSLSETLSLICRTLAEHQKVSVTLGVTPRNLTNQTQVVVDGKQTPARDLLQQILIVPNRHLYWQLLFDPSSKGYWLDIHAFRN
jgi:hypothetical protein